MWRKTGCGSLVFFYFFHVLFVLIFCSFHIGLCVFLRSVGSILVVVLVVVVVVIV